jgi:hypothetical protein
MSKLLAGPAPPFCRAYSSVCESGVQVGLSSVCGLAVIGVGGLSEPNVWTTISRLASLSTVWVSKAIRVPSGDHAGWSEDRPSPSSVPLSGVIVSATKSLTKRSNSSVFGSPVNVPLAKTTFVRSGDQLGCRLWPASGVSTEA